MTAGLAGFADRSRLRASLLVMLGFAVPPLIIIGAASGVLSALRRSVLDGLAVVVLGALPFVLLSASTQGAGSIGLIGLVMIAAVVQAELLRRMGLNLAMLAGLAAAMVVTLVIDASLGDVQAYWQSWFKDALERFAQAGSEIPAEQREIMLAAPIWERMTAVGAALVLVLSWLGMFLGRAWQARLVNPGGFGREFRSLSFGRIAAVGSMVLFSASVLTDAWWVHDLTTLLVYAWIVQGFAYIHWWVHGRPGAAALLAAIYTAFLVALFGTSPLVVLIPVGAVVGELVNGRRYLKRSPPEE